jgi:uncharacterized protein YcbK (DUF882 family)
MHQAGKQQEATTTLRQGETNCGHFQKNRSAALRALQKVYNVLPAYLQRRSGLIDLLVEVIAREMQPEAHAVARAVSSGARSSATISVLSRNESTLSRRTFFRATY